MYTLLLVLIYIAFISLGLPDSLLGSGWPVMHQNLQVPVSFMGIITMVISGGTVVSSLFSDRLTRKFGTRIVTVASVFLTAVALIGFSFSHQFWMLLVFAIPYGLGAGAIDAALNNYVALHYTSRHMSWLHCFWGVGTIFSPFVMSYALRTSTWNTGYRLIGIVQLGIGLLLLVTLPVWKVDTQEEENNAPAMKLMDVFKIRGVSSLLLGFFAYCALEATTMNWASTYVVEVKGISPERAARFAALFYIGMTVGRFLSGFIMNKLGDRKMIRLGICILSCGILTLLFPTGNANVTLVGLIIVGLGCAPIYPCIIHSTPSNFGAGRAGAIIGIQMSSAYIGATFLPPLFGFIARRIGFGIYPIYIALFMILSISMVERTFRVTAGEQSRAPEGRRCRAS